MRTTNESRVISGRALFAAVLALSFTASSADAQSEPEPYEARSALTLDDDLFSRPGSDRDYTGGATFTLSGARASRFSLDPVLGRIDRALSVDKEKPVAVHRQHALGVGVMAFTPHDVASTAPVFDDRPYASLVFLSSGRRYLPEQGNVAYSTNLVVGVLGLELVASGHRAIHRYVGSDPLRGYDHQISAGGEPTIRYGVARQALLTRRDNVDFKWTAAGNVGTVTEGSLAINGRWGRIRSPWWSVSPELNTYAADTQPLTAVAGIEAFFVAGARIRARAYNVFLQGQFRDSAVRYSANEINPVLAETWAGFVIRRPSGLELRYLARWGSPELRHGPHARSIAWGSLEFVRTF